MKKIILAFIFSTLILLTFTGPAFAGGMVKSGTVNWPPYYGEELPDGGFMTEITREALKRSGWDYRIEFMNWNRAMNLCLQGKLDMVQGAYNNAERMEKFLVTDEFASVDIVFFSKEKSGITYATLEDLEGYKIGLIRGWAYPKAITESGFLKTETTETPVSNIKKLLSGRVDLIVGARVAVIDIVNRELPDAVNRLVALTPPIQQNSLHNLVYKKNAHGPEIAEAFNRGLQQIKTDGTYEKILKKHGF